MITALIGFSIALIIAYLVEKHAKPDKIDKYMQDKEKLNTNIQNKKAPKKFLILLKTEPQNFFNHINHNWNYWNKPIGCDNYYIFNSDVGYSAALTVMNGDINVMFLPKSQLNNNISDDELLLLIDNFTKNVIIPYQNMYPEEISFKQIF